MQKSSRNILAGGLMMTATLLGMLAPAAAQGGAASKNAPRAADSAGTLPNGATSLNETFGDWAVNCAIVEKRKICAFSQQQQDSKSGQRVLAIELQPPADGKTEGVLIAPFGLKLDDGVKLALGEQGQAQTARFSTCLPSGCLVPLSFTGPTTDAMKKAEKLVITATRLGGGTPATFTVPLKGFASAMNRATELVK